jgi:uncharacterized repeat protein (TIGR03803 family)
MATDGSGTTLHVFTGGAGGSFPLGRLLEASDGNLYGTTAGGGDHGFGTIFRLSPDGAFTILHSFTESEPGGDRVANPTAQLLDAGGGVLYGSSDTGIFELTPGGLLRALHSIKNAWLVSAHGLAGLRFGWAPPVTPAAAFDLASTLPAGGHVGLFSVVVTSRLKVCSSWATADTGGNGPSAEELQDLLVRSPLPREWLSAVPGSPRDP